MSSDQEFDWSVEGMRRLAREHKLADRDPEDIKLERPAVHQKPQTKCYVCGCANLNGNATEICGRLVCQVCTVSVTCLLDVLRSDFVRARTDAAVLAGQEITKQIAPWEV